MASIESKQAYNPGDIIIKIQPQVYCISDECKSLFCDNCLKKSDQLKKCSKCRQMYYCDKDCQQNDWKCHKYECKVFRDPKWTTIKHDELKRNLLRWWLCYDSDPNFSSQKHQALNGTVFCLNDIQADYSALRQDWFTMKMMADSFEQHGLTIDLNKFKRWFCLTDTIVSLLQIPYPDVDVFDSEINDQIVGLGLLFQISWLNHSCQPNSSYLFQGINMELRAIKSIEIGQHITLALLDCPYKKRTDEPLHGCIVNHFSIECLGNICPLKLDRVVNYEDFYSLLAHHEKLWSSTKEVEGCVDKEYKIDWLLILFMRAIYGDHHPVITRALVKSFVYFAENSRYATKLVLKLWYKEIEPHIRVTHGSEHLYYKSFIKFAFKYI